MDVELRHLVDQVLDEQWLSRQLGRPARAARLRIKPGTSLVASVTDPSGTPTGWVRWLWPISHSKARKARRLAASLNLETWERPHGELLMQHGPILADPRLAERLHQAASLGTWDAVLRYNPLRRVVVRMESAVLRVEAAGDHSLGIAFEQFVASHIPTPPRLDDGQRPGISAHAFTGDGDLAAQPGRDGAIAAGELVARLHAVAPLPAALTSALADRASNPTAQGYIHAQLLTELAPDLAQRMTALAAQLPGPLDGPVVLSHGDLSPDQVLTSHDGSSAWLTDFDRACLAPAAMDLGSFLAVADPETSTAFLVGYARAGGQLPSIEVLDTAQAGSLILRAVDPLRRAAPDWETQIAANLNRIQEVLV